MDHRHFPRKYLESGTISRIWSKTLKSMWRSAGDVRRTWTSTIPPPSELHMLTSPCLFSMGYGHPWHFTHNDDPWPILNRSSWLLHQVGKNIDFSKDYCCQYSKVIQEKHFVQVWDPLVHHNGQRDTIHVYKSEEYSMENKWWDKIIKGKMMIRNREWIRDETKSHKTNNLNEDK